MCVYEFMEQINRPICCVCNSKNVYVNQDRTVVCRRCGHKEKTKEKKE